jgi:DNA-binding NtrC family response regulator
MPGKLIFLCVQRDILYPIDWSLREFADLIAVKHFDKISQLQSSLETEECSVLLLDSIVSGESTLDFARELKNVKPSIKIVLLVSIGTTKEEILEIIQSKIVNGVLLRPFTIAQVSEYISRLCGFQKHAETPWYMQSRKGQA